MKKSIVVFLFLILAGLYFYQSFVSKKGQEALPVNQPTNTVIYATDQRPGPSVIINFASLSKSGYIVIQEDDNGKLGRILGNSAVIPKGESRSIFVGLIRPSVNGESLLAVMYDDSGDKVFSPNIDVPVKDESGNIIFTKFLIDRNAAK